MCKWGNDIAMEVVIPAHLSHSGAAYRREIGIDACIAPIVRALNDGGVSTIQSCCGHGKAMGRIDLADGRVLIIANDEAQAAEALS
jgi:hypothetical protein